MVVKKLRNSKQTKYVNIKKYLGADKNVVNSTNYCPPTPAENRV